MTRTAAILAVAPVNFDAVAVLIGLPLAVGIGVWLAWRSLTGGKL